jgi:hypothetical protein
VRSELFGANLEAGTQDRFALQNPRLLRIALDGEVMARQGSMVAYQGQLDFAYQGSGGMGRFLKRHCCIEPKCAGEAQQSGGSPSWKGAKKGPNHSTVAMICRL